MSKTVCAYSPGFVPLALWAPDLIGWHTEMGTSRIINWAESCGLAMFIACRQIYRRNQISI